MVIIEYNWSTLLFFFYLADLSFNHQQLLSMSGKYLFGSSKKEIKKYVDRGEQGTCPEL